jgi:hypothetical protein
VTHARWLADRIPAAILSTEPGAGHFSALTAVPAVLSWLIRPLDAAIQ